MGIHGRSSSTVVKGCMWYFLDLWKKSIENIILIVFSCDIIQTRSWRSVRPSLVSAFIALGSGFCLIFSSVGTQQYSIDLSHGQSWLPQQQHPNRVTTSRPLLPFCCCLLVSSFEVSIVVVCNIQQQFLLFRFVVLAKRDSPSPSCCCCRRRRRHHHPGFRISIIITHDLHHLPISLECLVSWQWIPCYCCHPFVVLATTTVTTFQHSSFDTISIPTIVVILSSSSSFRH